MADENANTTTNDTTTTTNVETTQSTGSPPAGERTFTQAEVNRIVAERLARVNPRPAEQARTNAQNTAAPPQNTQPASVPAPAAYDAEALGDALAEFQFDKEQRAEIRAAARRDGISDVDAFVAKWARMFGKQPGSAATPATPAPESPAPKTHSGPPVTGSGAPANPTNVVTDDTPILRLSEDARKALLNRIGPAAYVERMRKEFRTVRVRG
jgi:hypothetical protein